MKLLLTTSRNPSQRVRQFIKEFSFLFPKNIVSKTNRGKNSLTEIFSNNIEKFERILIITNKFGNPHKIVGYKKNENEFIWSFDLKIKSVKLSSETQFVDFKNPDYTILSFQKLNRELIAIFQEFFDPLCEQLPNQDDKSNKMSLLVSYSNPGFKIEPYLNDEIKISPEISIDEIIISDSNNDDDDEED